MPTFRYVVVDVFTDTALAGNQLGVFTDAWDQPGLEKFWTESLQIDQPQTFFRHAILPCAHTEFNMQEMRNRLWKAWGVRLESAR